MLEVVWGGGLTGFGGKKGKGLILCLDLGSDGQFKAGQRASKIVVGRQLGRMWGEQGALIALQGAGRGGMGTGPENGGHLIGQVSLVVVSTKGATLSAAAATTTTTTV